MVGGGIGGSEERSGQCIDVECVYREGSVQKTRTSRLSGRRGIWCCGGWRGEVERARVEGRDV